MFKKALAVAGICLIGAASVAYAADMHDQRISEMKKIGGSLGAMVAIVKGKKPYDAGTVKTSLETISATIKTFPELFPGSAHDGDAEASPKIWENKDDFKAHAAKLGADADKLLADLPADQAAVGAALHTLGGNCAACHKAYRIKD